MSKKAKKKVSITCPNCLSFFVGPVDAWFVCNHPCPWRHLCLSQAPKSFNSQVSFILNNKKFFIHCLSFNNNVYSAWLSMEVDGVNFEKVYCQTSFINQPQAEKIIKLIAFS